jgi:RNA polymerase subunit RPABC4/transcription elongation factor Spt4
MVVFGLFGKKKDPPPVIAPQNVKLCKGCGKLLQLDVLVCDNCGAKEKFCKKCGKTIPVHVIHCQYCGQMCD